MVLSNTGQVSAVFGLGVGTNNPPSLENLKRAQSFRTGTNSLGYHLNTATISGGGAAGSGRGDLLLELHQMHFGGTSTHLGAFLVAENPIVAGLYAYEFLDPSLVLLPATTYAIVARSPASSGPTVSQYGWRQAFGSSWFTAPGWQFTGLYASGESGLTWTSLRADIHQFALDATAIPEPRAIYLAGGLAMSSGFLFRRRT